MLLHKKCFTAIPQGITEAAEGTIIKGSMQGEN